VREWESVSAESFEPKACIPVVLSAGRFGLPVTTVAGTIAGVVAKDVPRGFFLVSAPHPLPSSEDPR
jgi:thiamine transporter ThiT